MKVLSHEYLIYMEKISVTFFLSFDSIFESLNYVNKAIENRRSAIIIQ